ncbi:TM1266 family iron-only hydrogenase system putative regulator [Athalassotoga saccharophila]|uniref:TM1266 family iron-only hydrogenase system putative regulator n=1 Tax=Athalassotoga saccharophila TaxID=1441386 RepID=UPI00137B3D29|nr:TM1266 family iron-only hydrogenase system putative regulator [Athalassotoga saccharophila]BBJ27775.1 hypothetical protein ATHSA_0666 [Athalassotoga saccharophila]
METTQTTNRRLGVVAIVIKNREESYSQVNEILHDYANIIVGRMGIPYKDRNISIISVIVDGTTDEIGAMTGKLGRIMGVSVKSMLASIDK